MNNKRFLFLVGWMEGSDSAIENGLEETNLNDQKDLVTEYRKGSSFVGVVEVFAPNADVAAAIGWHHSISESGGSYTMNDTFSSVTEIKNNVVLVPTKKKIDVPRFTVTDTAVVEDVNKG